MQWFLYLLILILSACGSYQPKTFAPPSLTKPEYAASYPQNLNLKQLNEDLTYQGSMIVFDSNISQQQMLAIAKSSKFGRLAYAEANKFRSEVLQPAQRQLLETQKRFAAHQSRFALDESLQTQRWQLAQSWFADAIAELEVEQAVTADEVGRLRDVLPRYCEAKLWQWALDGAVSEVTYTKRPTAQAFCEGYYAEHGLLTGALCNDAAGDYFQCFWREGVLKTKLFAESYPQTISGTELTPQQVMQTWLQVPAEGVSPWRQALRKQRARLSQAMLTQKKIKSFKRLGLSEQKQLAKIFISTREDAEDYAGATPKQLLDVLELPEQASLQVFAKEEKTDDQLQKIVSFELALQAMGTTLESSASQHRTLGDFLFNRPTNSLKKNPTAAQFERAELALRLDFSKLSGSYADTARELLATAAALEAAIAQNNQKYQQLQGLELKYSIPGSLAAMEPGAALLFLTGGVSVDVSRTEDTLKLRLQFQPGSQDVHLCWSLSQAQQISCDEEGTLPTASLQVDTESLSFTIQLKIEEPEDYGLGRMAPSSQAPVSNFNALDLRGKTLELKLYQNILQTYTRLLTGDVRIFSAKQELLHAGGISLKQ